MRDYSRVTASDVEFFRTLLGERNVANDPWELLIASQDALLGVKGRADIVLWPSNKDEVSSILRYCTERRIPVTPRGGGSSLSGNAIPVFGGVVLSTRRMNKIVEVIPEDMTVVVEPGVVYDELNNELSKYNLFFPPDPASGRVCTIGGMVANNSSGLRAVKYGVTRDYVLRLEVVLPTGDLITVGTLAPKSSIGYDLVRLFVGSEGTLGVFTQIALKLRPLPEHRVSGVFYFDSPSKAIEAATRLLSSTTRPSAIEYLDKRVLELLNNAGYPFDVSQAALLVEADGDRRRAIEDFERIKTICLNNGGNHHELTEDDVEKAWEGRRSIGAIIAEITPSFIAGDIDVPISKLVTIIQRSYELAGKHGVDVVAFGHVGDGNVHVMILIDRRSKESLLRAHGYYSELLNETVKLGGAISGEHGIGLEKKEFMAVQHGEKVLWLMKKIKEMVDPSWIMNPGKMLV